MENTGRRKIVTAALWTEICLAFPVIRALSEGYEIYLVTDASGGTNVEAHEIGIQRMIQAGAIPLTAGIFMAELQRDWAREEIAGKVGEIMLEHGGASAPIWLGNSSFSLDGPALASDRPAAKIAQ